VGSDADETLAALESLLSGGSVERAERLEQSVVSTFSSSRDVVLFGAGGLGRRTLAGLRSVGIEPLAFVDNAPGLWGEQVDGVGVLSPDFAAREWGTKAAFVVTIWRAEGGHAYASTRDQLRSLGCQRVHSFLELYWAFPGAFLPYLAASRPTEMAAAEARVMQAFALFTDEVSRAEFVAQARWRLLGDFEAVSQPSHGCDAANEYWPDGLYRIGPGESVVDCGAYDGDTLARFLDRFGACGGWLAFEPDPGSAAAMRGRVSGLDPTLARGVSIREAATGERPGTVSFAALGTAASRVAEGADVVKVPVVTLDDECQGIDPTLVKLDVEGQERATMCGARSILARGRAVWAVSCYHRQSDLWDLPLLARELAPSAHVYLRAHAAEAFDLVLYVVPDERVAESPG